MIERKKEGTYLERDSNAQEPVADRPDCYVYGQTPKTKTAKSAAKAKQEATAFKERYFHDYGP